jgi:hypothetical protein
MNNWSFWIMPFAFTLLLSTLFMPGGGPAGGWTLYPPLVLQTGDAFPFVILAIHMMGVSSIMGAINVIATILNMRAPGMTLMKMPLFVWTWLITAFLLIAVMPVLAGAVTMLLTDKYFGTSQLASPTKAGITAPKIIANACRVVSWLKKWGSTICRPGMNSSARISNAMAPPTKNIASENSRYRVPMSLWLVVNNQRPKPLGGPACSACSREDEE